MYAHVFKSSWWEDVPRDKMGRWAGDKAPGSGKIKRYTSGHRATQRDMNKFLAQRAVDFGVDNPDNLSGDIRDKLLREWDKSRRELALRQEGFGFLFA